MRIGIQDSATVVVVFKLPLATLFQIAVDFPLRNEIGPIFIAATAKSAKNSPPQFPSLLLWGQLEQISTRLLRHHSLDRSGSPYRKTDPSRHSIGHISSRRPQPGKPPLERLVSIVMARRIAFVREYEPVPPFIARLPLLLLGVLCNPISRRGHHYSPQQVHTRGLPAFDILLFGLNEDNPKVFAWSPDSYVLHRGFSELPLLAGIQDNAGSSTTDDRRSLLGYIRKERTLGTCSAP